MSENSLKLHSYYRSSCSYRVRIALHHKNIPFEYIPVHLVKDGGEQFSDKYIRLNPMKQVPTLVDTNSNLELNQSMAIIDYLENKYPEPTLFSKNIATRALIIQACEIINSGIQPMQNLSALKHLSSNYSFTDQQKKEWTVFWIENGFIALEKLLEKTSGDYSFDDQITAADLFLVPQVYNANRFEVDMSKFPNLKKVNNNALKLEAFKLADPANQPDTP